MRQDSAGWSVPKLRELVLGCPKPSLIATLSLVLASIAAVALPIIFWDWLRGADAGSTTIRNVVLIEAAIVAFPLAIWRALVADRQASTAKQSLLNERYQKGAEMIGSDVLSVRLGGIYALQSLAAEHPDQYHVQVMHLFCAFARHPTRDQSPDSARLETEPGPRSQLRQDVQAIMKIVNDRPDQVILIERRDDFTLDFLGADLPTVQFRNADLSGALFRHANLSNATFHNADLSAAVFSYANLSGAAFWDNGLTGIRLDSANLSGALLQDADLATGILHSINLAEANLHRADLSGATFQDASMTNAWLEDANLSGASFLSADLSGARLMNADLSQASFLDARLDEANLTGANLSGAEFSSTGNQPARGLKQDQLTAAWADPDTPPLLTGVHDSETGAQLAWRGRRPQINPQAASNSEEPLPVSLPPEE